MSLSLLPIMSRGINLALPSARRVTRSGLIKADMYFCSNQSPVTRQSLTWVKGVLLLPAVSRLQKSAQDRERKRERERERRRRRRGVLVLLVVSLYDDDVFDLRYLVLYDLSVYLLEAICTWESLLRVSCPGRQTIRIRGV